MAAQGRQPKTMSSRLANMKFMQRGNSTPASPSTPAEPPTKKMRLASGASKATPASPAGLSPSTGDGSSVDLGKGEQWYLSFKTPQTQIAPSPLRIVSAGFSALDAADEGVKKEEKDEDQESDEEAAPKWAGRKSFGKFNRKLEKQQNPDLSSSSDDEDEEEEDDDRSDGEIPEDPVNKLIAQGEKDAAARIRAERKAKKKSDGAESARMAEQRRKKDLNLNRVANEDSPFGRQRGSPLSAMSKVECYQCHGKGHMAKDCPERQQQQQRQQQRRSGSRLSYD